MNDQSILQWFLLFQLTVDYKGKESHASAFPWEGVNALDAAVALYQSIGLLRQQMKPSCRIHGKQFNNWNSTIYTIHYSFH